MSEPVRELIVFPTELVLRRYQQEQALKYGFADASGHTTFARIRKLCLPYAGIKGRQMNAAQKALKRREIVEVAAGYFQGQGALGEVSRNALGDILDQLVTELASMPGEVPEIIDWLLTQRRGEKLYQLGTLISVWRATIKQEGFADAIDVNLAVLKLLKDRREKWPPLLRDCKTLTFKSVRWFNPFEESCVVALNRKLKIQVESALPPAHAEAAADRLGQQIRSELMAEPWAVWAEDLGDALAVDCPDVLQFNDPGRIAFSRSAGAYGEIEDLARRICWNLQERKMEPNRIALVVPNIGTVQDIVPHVFSRFQIPYFFRRGRPVLSSPVVKAFFAWLAFPLRPERDAMIDLVRNPAIHFENRESEVEELLKQPPRLKLFPADISGTEAAEIMNGRMIEPEDHFNSEALNAVKSLLENLGDHSIPLRELVDLLEELLENETVRPQNSHEQGVWILNPHDAVGLDFDLVLFAGLNEGEFPGVPHQDALLSDMERYRLKTHLAEKGYPLPKMAFPEAGVLFEQQAVLFLTTLGMAREQLVFSCQSVDQEGNEKSAGEYYRKLWNLAGWCTQESIQLSPYDQWRIGRLSESNVFLHHFETQQILNPEDRIPMPGESFLTLVPLPLCRAKDEALQAAVQHGRLEAGGTAVVPSASSRLPVEHLVEMLNIEAEREAFLETPAAERFPSIYCGHIGALKEKVSDWFAQKNELSPTALETLAQNRYVFLIEQVFGMKEPRVADDTPDPMDRGGLIHSILQEIYSKIANGEAGIDSPRLFAVENSGGWTLRKEGGIGAIPLAVFVPSLAEKYEAFAEEVAIRRMNRVQLGHSGIWSAEKSKVLEIVLNFVRYDVETCTNENRYPALFELKFGGETAVNLDVVKLGGKIDRIDLVFEKSGELQKVRVLDYKGSSRSRSKTEDYVDEMVRNLDCQLPVYAFVARDYFFGGSEEWKSKTEVGYLFYERDYSKISGVLKKSLVTMDEEGLIEGFLSTLHKNIGCLKNGDFAVDPLIETYNDYTSVCRTNAVARDELE